MAQFVERIVTELENLQLSSNEPEYGVYDGYHVHDPRAHLSQGGVAGQPRHVGVFDQSGGQHGLSYGTLQRVDHRAQIASQAAAAARGLSVHPECTKRYGSFWTESGETLRARLAAEMKMQETLAYAATSPATPASEPVSAKPTAVVNAETGCQNRRELFTDTSFQPRPTRGPIAGWFRPHEVTYHDNRILNPEVTTPKGSPLHQQGLHALNGLSSPHRVKRRRSCGCFPCCSRKDHKHWVGGSRPLSARARSASPNAYQHSSRPGAADKTGFGSYPQNVGIKSHLDKLPAAQRGEDWQLFRGPIQAADVKQGELGNTWMVSSMIAVAGFQGGRLIHRLLPGQLDRSKEGVYLVKLCIGGGLHDVLVDDRLPCSERATPSQASWDPRDRQTMSQGTPQRIRQLAYCATLRCQLWASIIEKAFAKAYGSYEGIGFTDASEPLAALTAHPCITLPSDKARHNPAYLTEIWDTVFASKISHYLVTCSTRSGSQLKSAGLLPDHVYSLESLVDAAEGRFVKLRAPYLSAVWKGNWSPSSPMWTAHLRKSLTYSEADAASGVFMMALDDFLEWFACITICKVLSADSFVQRMSVSFPSNLVPVDGWSLQVKEPAKCLISVFQPEGNARKGPLFEKHMLGPLASIGFVLLHDEGGQPVAISDVHLECKSVVCAHCWLQPNLTYRLLPMSLHPGMPIPGVCCVMSQTSVVISDCPFRNEDARAAWGAFCRRQSVPAEQDSAPGARLFLSASDDGAAIAWAENSGSENMIFELSFRQRSNYSRGAPQSWDCLLPGQSQLLQVALPIHGQFQDGRGETPKFQIMRQVDDPEYELQSDMHKPDLNLDRTGFMHMPSGGAMMQGQLERFLSFFSPTRWSCQATNLCRQQLGREEEAEILSQIATMDFVPSPRSATVGKALSPTHRGLQGATSKNQRLSGSDIEIVINNAPASTTNAQQAGLYGDALYGGSSGTFAGQNRGGLHGGPVGSSGGQGSSGLYGDTLYGDP
eukprot:TRINITY_DN2321_c0_g1_i2.p1 TRINITY_DN2321_c0_g1~~TRINITY_DN2321_c0_g1_i2.p1  ORF type:complete len:1036 (+),score=121.65 TRINITY_DN2321_c0_g1_i2:123-3110(+)